MPILYEIVHGKMTRKDHEGNECNLGPRDRLVPSPSELSAERYRMKPVGTVGWDSKDAKAALQNTNRKDYPNFGKDDDDGDFIPEQLVADDIRAVKDAKTTIDVIAQVTSVDILDRYFAQEAENQPRIRKSVLKAIEDRREQLKPHAIAVGGKATGTGDE